MPLTESEQIVKAMREHGRAVWFRIAIDEGHGFQKKRNVDFQFMATIEFLPQTPIEMSMDTSGGEWQ